MQRTKLRAAFQRKADRMASSSINAISSAVDCLFDKTPRRKQTPTTKSRRKGKDKSKEKIEATVQIGGDYASIMYSIGNSDQSIPIVAPPKQSKPTKRRRESQNKRDAEMKRRCVN